MYQGAWTHDGYSRLLKWASSKPKGSFVYTSNVDGLFHKAGFDPNAVLDCHESIHYLQCSKPYPHEFWSSADVSIVVNDVTKVSERSLPRCKKCRRSAQPNILMFDDMAFLRGRSRSKRKGLKVGCMALPVIRSLFWKSVQGSPSLESGKLPNTWHI